MSTKRTPRTDKELWRSLAPDGSAAPAAVSDLDFAAWLDGRLPEADATQVEAVVAADSSLRRAALDLADVLGKPLPAAPDRLAVRARALVGFEAERRGAQGGGWFGWLFSSGTRYALQRAAMAGMAIMIAGAGFVVGGGLGESFAQERYGTTAGATGTATTSNEFSEFFVADGI